MTLAEVLLRYTGCRELTDLPQAARVPEQNKKIIAAIERLDAGQVPMTEWTELSDAFGLPPQDSPGDARNALLLKLSSVIAETALAEEPSVLREITEEPKSADAPPPEEQSDSPKESPPKKEPSKTLKTVLRIWNAITTVLVVIVVALAVVLAGVRVFGLQVFSVLSGSMEPEYHVGALIYVQKVDPYTLQVGDDITFLLDEETVATHRIVGILPDENDPTVIRFRTQGIANDQEDGTPVHYMNVVGKPIFTIPYLGYVAHFIQNPPGTYVAVSIGALILFLIFLPDVLTEDNSGEKTEKKKKKPKKGEPAEDAEPETQVSDADGITEGKTEVETEGDKK